MFTDSFVTECIWHKGTVKSRLLHGFVQRLRKLERTGQLTIHMIWVAAGTRMSKQGTYGLSQGNVFTGVIPRANQQGSDGASARLGRMDSREDVPKEKELERVERGGLV
jgi:hypothetical protein